MNKKQRLNEIFGLLVIMIGSAFGIFAMLIPAAIKTFGNKIYSLKKYPLAIYFIVFYTLYLPLALVNYFATDFTMTSDVIMYWIFVAIISLFSITYANDAEKWAEKQRKTK